jgi:hypothetical protein
MVLILGLTGVRLLPVISSDCCPGPRWLTLFAVSDCRRDTREHLMLGFSENPHSRFRRD